MSNVSMVSKPKPTIQSEEKHDPPFSMRNKAEYKSNKFRISMPMRRQFYAMVQEFDEQVIEKDEKGLEKKTDLTRIAFRILQTYYQPKCFVDEGKYAKTDNIELFIMATSPPCVLDYLEAFSQCSSKVVTDRINKIFVLNNLSFKLENGKIKNAYTCSPIGESFDYVKETKVRNLIEEAQQQFKEENFQTAIVKIWEAFEKLKTYYSPQLENRKAAAKILETAGQSNAPFMSLLEEEFKALTRIGNDLHILHHESGKAILSNELHLAYLYRRCFILIDLVSRFL